MSDEDRLEEIKAIFDDPPYFYGLDLDEVESMCEDIIRWLIGEVERLRAKVDELELAAELLRNDILEMGERETR